MGLRSSRSGAKLFQARWQNDLSDRLSITKLLVTMIQEIHEETSNFIIEVLIHLPSSGEDNTSSQFRRWNRPAVVQCPI